MYVCMDCCKEFEELENNACPYCGSGDVVKEDDVVEYSV